MRSDLSLRGSSSTEIANTQPEKLKKKRGKFEHLILGSVLLLFYFTQITIASDSQTIEYRAIYKIELRGLEIGTGIRKVSNQDDGILEITHVINPNNLAALLGERPLKQVTRVFQKESSFIPLSYQVLEDENILTSVRFDWNRNYLIYENKDNLSIPDNPIFDFESWVLFISSEPSQDRRYQIVSLVGPKRVKTFQYLPLEKERISVTGESVETWKIKIAEINNEQRGYIVWIAPSLKNVPVKLSKFKGKSALNFDIQELEIYLD